MVDFLGILKTKCFPFFRQIQELEEITKIGNLNLKRFQISIHVDPYGMYILLQKKCQLVSRYLHVSGNVVRRLSGFF